MDLLKLKLVMTPFITDILDEPIGQQTIRDHIVCTSDVSKQDVIRRIVDVISESVHVEIDEIK